jgi:hypothetical protein
MPPDGGSPSRTTRGLGVGGAVARPGGADPVSHVGRWWLRWGTTMEIGGGVLRYCRRVRPVPALGDSRAGVSLRDGTPAVGPIWDSTASPAGDPGGGEGEEDPTQPPPPTIVAPNRWGPRSAVRDVPHAEKAGAGGPHVTGGPLARTRPRQVAEVDVSGPRTRRWPTRGKPRILRLGKLGGRGARESSGSARPPQDAGSPRHRAACPRRAPAARWPMRGSRSQAPKARGRPPKAPSGWCRRAP